MIKPGDHTVQIAAAVLASAEPRPDVHLIEHGAVPPAVLVMLLSATSPIDSAGFPGGWQLYPRNQLPLRRRLADT
jgi:hypothetical protein